MLKKLIGRGELDFYLAELHFAETVNLIDKIYFHRNFYTHALENPNDERWISTKTEREILKMISAFTDAFEQGSRYTFASRIPSSVLIRNFLIQQIHSDKNQKAKRNKE